MTQPTLNEPAQDSILAEAWQVKDEISAEIGDHFDAYLQLLRREEEDWKRQNIKTSAA